MINGLNLQELIQIGVNNLIVMQAEGKPLSKDEILLLEQWARANQADQRLKELVINEEISYYDDTGRDTRKMAPKNTRPESGGNRNEDTDVHPPLE